MQGVRPARSPTIAPMSSGPPTVLVVDDDPSMRRFLDTLLSHNGFRTVGAATAAEALEWLGAQNGAGGDPVAAVILDALLPDMRGFDLARRLVGEDRTRGVPICFLSGAFSGRAPTGAGIACILKPALPKQVMATLQAVAEGPAAPAAERLDAIAAVERLSML